VLDFVLRQLLKSATKEKLNDVSRDLFRYPREFCMFIRGFDGEKIKKGEPRLYPLLPWGRSFRNVQALFSSLNNN
jgi:hypothetical protein